MMFYTHGIASTAGDPTLAMTINSDQSVAIAGALSAASFTTTGDIKMTTNTGRIKLGPSTSEFQMASNPGDGAGDFHIWDYTGSRRVLGYNRDSNQLLLGAAGTSLRMPATVWHFSTNGAGINNNRFFFNVGGSTLFGSPDGYSWQSATYANILTLSNSGLLTVKSLNIGTQTLQEYIADVSGSSTDITANTATIGTGPKPVSGANTSTFTTVYPPDLCFITSNSFFSNNEYAPGSYTFSDSANTASSWYAFRGGGQSSSPWGWDSSYNSTTGAYTGTATTTVGGTAVKGGWVQMICPQAVSFNRVGWSGYTGQGTNTMVIAASQNGSTWVQAYSGTAGTVNLAAIGPYRYWRLIITVHPNGANAYLVTYYGASVATMSNLPRRTSSRQTHT